MGRWKDSEEEEKEEGEVRVTNTDDGREGHCYRVWGEIGREREGDQDTMEWMEIETGNSRERQRGLVTSRGWCRFC